MRKWIALVTCTACCFSSIAVADAPPLAAQPAPTEEATTPETAPVQTEDTTRKPVGKAAADGSNTGWSANLGKYALAAGAVAVAITALILVSRHSGHHKH